MFFLLAALAVLDVLVPTGISSTSRLDTERSPLESLPPAFLNISAPLRQPVNGNTVLVVVADYVAGPLSAELLQFQTDLMSEGWTVTVQTMAGGTAADLKALLQSAGDIDGSIFVGFLPCAWFEEDYWATEEFPCELYFMDLDGVWSDSDSDGLFDSHSGNVLPRYGWEELMLTQSISDLNC